MPEFYSQPIESVLKTLNSSPIGLTQSEAEKRFKTNGTNTIERRRQGGIVKLFLSQFKDVMTILLIVAAFVSAVIAFFSGDKSDLTDTFIILFIIFLNAAVGTAQQFRADRAIENLKKLSVCKVKCRRGGKDLLIDSEQLVTGDIITLEEGDMVPADCRIISCAALKCDESALTGESVGVEKSAVAVQAVKAPEGVKGATAASRTTANGAVVALTSQTNMLFSSTYVLSGTACAVVTSTGMDTEIGKIAGMLSDSKPTPTPLENSLNKLGKIITGFVLCVTAFLFIFGLVVRKVGILSNFMTSVAIAVAAIPEGLPAVVTIIMAMGVQRMSKKNVVIRRLKSVETLGGCNYVCTDKTGTLTENKMKAAEVTLGAMPFDAATPQSEKMVMCMHSCVNVKGERGAYMGDPTEVAIKEFAVKYGGFKGERLAENPFTSERKMMSVAVRTGGNCYIYAKGAPDVLLKHCIFIEDKNGKRLLTEKERKDLTLLYENMSARALRVIAFAYGIYAGHLNENGLTFLGFCGMADGLKSGVKEAVAECVTAGITTVMITGDHKKTAFAIARDAGIASDISQVISGDEFERLDNQGKMQAVERCTVFARVTPAHKNSIVKCLKQGGNVVAMTGDGVNDAPSIKTADIGIAMGRSGTDVTKNASDMVITDDNFTTIVAAVREGRRIFANIKKTINFFIATNLAEVLSILFASIVFFNYSFLRSTQLLWINLITDSFPVLALGTERADDYAMQKPPERAEKALFSKQSLTSVLIFGVYMTAATVAVFVIGLYVWDNSVASTMTFLTVSFLELFHAFNIRSEREPFFKGLFTNKILIFTVTAAVVVNVLLCVIPPFASAFNLTTLNAVQWGIVAGVSLSVIAVGELYKIVLRHRDKKKKVVICPSSRP